MNLGYHCCKSSQNSFFPTGIIPERKRIGLYVSSMSSWKLWGTSLTVTFYTFHPNHFTRGWKNYHHFTEKNWGEVRNADLVYNSLGWQTGICCTAYCRLLPSGWEFFQFMYHAGKEVPAWACQDSTKPSPAEKAFHHDFVASGMTLPQLTWSPGLKPESTGRFVLICAFVSDAGGGREKEIYKPDSIEIRN